MAYDQTVSIPGLTWKRILRWKTASLIIPIFLFLIPIVGIIYAGLLPKHLPVRESSSQIWFIIAMLSSIFVPLTWFLLRGITEGKKLDLLTRYGWDGVSPVSINVEGKMYYHTPENFE